MPHRIMKESLNPILDSLADGILVTEAQGNIILCNQKAETILGIKGEDALGQQVQDYIKNEALVNLINKTLALNVPYHTEELCIFSLGATRLRINVSPVRAGSGLLIGSVTLLHDVAQLNAIDRVKSNFLSMVSHQLKSPLSSTLLQTSILLDGIVGELNDKQMDLLQKVRNRIKGMVDLIRDILDVCFIEEGGYLKQIEHLDVAEILKRTVELIQPQAQDKNIALHVKIDDNLPVISGNRSSVEALFINLISNAIKYTPPGGKVNVEMGENAQNVQLEVNDTGIGVEDVDFPRIFDKFYRVRSDMTKNISGTGLGLSIVKSVVDANYGTINIESKVGEGTTFTVLLPAK